MASLERCLGQHPAGGEALAGLDQPALVLDFPDPNDLAVEVVGACERFATFDGGFIVPLRFMD